MSRTISVEEYEKLRNLYDQARSLRHELDLALEDLQSQMEAITLDRGPNTHTFDCIWNETPVDTVLEQLEIKVECDC